MKMNEIMLCNRPIEKMLADGPASLSNEELLAIIINTGTKGKSSLDISYEIINSVNSLSDMLNLSIVELMKFTGIKKTKACRIEASIELTRRLISFDNRQEAFISHQTSAKYLYSLLKGYETEHLVVLYLNNRCKLITKDESKGGSNYVNIEYNEIIKNCIKNNARGVILAHNHPSGDVSPSKKDIASTNELIKKFEEFNLIVFDHIIIGSKSYYSFNEGLEFGININQK